MNGSEFVDSVARHSGIPQAQADALTRATLQTLAERLTAGEARDLGEQLPRELRDDLCQAQGGAEPFGLAEFLQRVSSRAGVDAALADKSVPAVFKTICKEVTSDEFDDMMAQLPEEFWDVREPAGARVGVERRPEVPARSRTAADAGRGRRDAPEMVRKENPR
ncbi:Uncharacterized conserved protein, DUF2267 family [Micromonospora rhizosphaerae]|uniref:Uncharacterized conserved protein, DUF2267 family n=1 Tax=Micromonospora rhizosphaerae TaxID=568872 RepID=A0A1C6SUF8_9ACTN|nr:DUF2267 domain-containing protein [Micromonospora rhizosphaerae]SCL33009.1 Uncharacterized conserved protein, DUF2267 family [Micromonospora rhizosphaerae]